MTASNQPTASLQPSRIDALVIGAGFGGMYAVHKLSGMGLTVQGIEAGGDVGGVWYWNRYPGARCDLMSLDYCYSFSPEIEQDWTWSEQFAAQPEILAYANFVADRLGLRRRFLFETRVTGATYDDATRIWRVTTDDGRIFEATYCVMASGPLSIPKGVPFDGAEVFKGEILLAAKWPHEPVSFAGKRVGLVGTGSTGVQIVPEVAKTADALTVFQRTPSFSLPMRNVALEPDYVAEIKRNYASIRQAARNSPLGGVRPQSTRPFFSVTPDQRRALMEDSWARGGLSFLGTFSDLLTNPEANEQVAEFVRDKISEVVVDPHTAEKLKPRGYPIFARRPCLDTQYYETFNLPHVTLHDCLESPIIKITEAGLLTSVGEVELDVLIFATGYDGLTGALLNFDVRGRGGLQLRDKWHDGAGSHLGLMMASFPNLFLVCGPNGPAALANIITLDQQNVDWIADAIARMRQDGLATMEPTGRAEQGWMDAVYGLAEQTLVSKANTWYVGGNISGKPRGLSMYTGGFQRYSEACRLAAESGYVDFVFEKAAVESAPGSLAVVGG
ncbi:cyclohexanone monooxygenase [Caulobacter sp. Root655]|uniref:flavin-containing monooxygenase n=1 Tax=Caulobacter sp. Root655 TaxID=1736578 RepID=UPI0006F494A8|nr:NAD(P)/FAD-dependent oxidoreductase [Caulobacter sp. Root655]KRA60381.1 cyclohexanone monooxygenase [Caulobacter sp. Root655]